MRLLNIEEFEKRYRPFINGLYQEIKTRDVYKVEFDYGKAIILNKVMEGKNG